MALMRVHVHGRRMTAATMRDITAALFECVCVYKTADSLNKSLNLI